VAAFLKHHHRLCRSVIGGGRATPAVPVPASEPVAGAPPCTPGSWRVVATDPADRANPALPLRQLQDSPYSGWLFESHASWMTHQLPEFRTTTHCSVLSVD